jgi:hypothetical protein
VRRAVIPSGCWCFDHKGAEKAAGTDQILCLPGLDLPQHWPRPGLAPGLPSAKVIAQYFLRPPADLPAIVGPEALAPVAVATGLGRHEVKEGVAIALLLAGHAGPEDLFAEEGADLLHGPQDIVVAAYPGEVTGPAPALHVEAVIGVLELLDDTGQALGTVAGLHPLPDLALEEGLDHRQVGGTDTQGEEVLQILAGVQQRHG